MQFDFTKEHVYSMVLKEIDERILIFSKLLFDLNLGAQNDAKSSAGDKHETSISMMHIEQEKIGMQLNEVKEIKIQLSKIVIAPPNGKVMIGSLVKTNQGIFYIAVALGKVMINGVQIFVLSPQSPLAQKLLNLKKKQETELNSKRFIVEEIL